MKSIMLKISMCVGLFSTILLTGCVSSGATQSSYPLFAMPLQPSAKQELRIAQLSQLLNDPKLTEDQAVDTFLQRGLVLQSVGLSNLASVDYTRALKIDNKNADAYNLLGLYFRDNGDFDSAFDALDSSLEIQPDDLYVQRNRAITMYYSGRVDIATDEMKAVVKQDPADDFSAIWLYFLQSESDRKLAHDQLQAHYDTSQSEEWSKVLIEIILGKVNSDDVFNTVADMSKDNVELALNLTEAYFYLGKEALLDENYGEAITMNKLAVSLNAYSYTEHGLAFLEIEHIYKTLQAKKTAEELANTAS